MGMDNDQATERKDEIKPLPRRAQETIEHTFAAVASLDQKQLNNLYRLLQERDKGNGARPAALKNALKLSELYIPHDDLRVFAQKKLIDFMTPSSTQPLDPNSEILMTKGTITHPVDSKIYVRFNPDIKIILGQTLVIDDANVNVKPIEEVQRGVAERALILK